MSSRAATLIRIAALAGALTLAACQDRNAELASLDNQIVGNDADPALTNALEDQILVDPALTQQSNRNAVRPPETPTQAQYPLPARRAAQVSRDGRPVAQTAQATEMESVRGAGCEAELDYNMAWARRMPAAFAVFPGGRVTDAAGSDSANCRARVVTFTSNAAPARVLEWYRSRASQAGYSAEQQMRQGDHILAGTGGGGAYFLILTPRGSGSEVAIIANNRG